MEALHDVVNLGYAHYIGMSSCRAWECMLVFYYNHVANYAIVFSSGYAEYASSPYVNIRSTLLLNRLRDHTWTHAVHHPPDEL